jgi:hypothetical protein
MLFPSAYFHSFLPFMVPPTAQAAAADEGFPVPDTYLIIKPITQKDKGLFISNYSGFIV